MIYYSTNNPNLEVSLQEAVVKGLAADRGLFMPERIPSLPKAFFNNIGNMSLQEISFIVANTLFGKDVESEVLKDIVYDALNFDIPLKHVTGNMYSLELFHGPTLAFKDVGARFMARLFQLEEQRQIDGECAGCHFGRHRQRSSKRLPRSARSESVCTVPARESESHPGIAIHDTRKEHHRNRGERHI